jgi:predicted ATP-binding protein involved in virulence
MRIDKLHVENFKRFARQDFHFHPRFTLLIGDNGSGKTSVLDALSVAAGVWLVEAPDSMLANSGRNILETEVRLEPQGRGDRIQFQQRRPVIVQVTGRIGDHENVTWERRINADGKRTSNAQAKTALKYVKETYSRDSAGERVLCPVLACYGAGRAWLPSNQRVPRQSKSEGPARRWGAFYDCFSERIRFAELRKWFLSEAIERGNRGGRWRPGFEVVRKAVLRCVPDSDDVWFSTDRDQIVLSINGNTQPFDNLSAGQRMMLGLTADIAIKAVTQNAFLVPPDELGPQDEPVPKVLRDTPGVVLIDELDVHLHPKWQRRVATDLKETFPGIQFVCTTHSPQVIGEVKPEEIRLLQEAPPLEESRISQPSQSFGMDSNWILEVLMDGKDMDPGVKNDIKAVQELAVRREFQQARALLASLRERVGNAKEIQLAASTVDRVELLGR